MAVVGGGVVGAAVGAYDKREFHPPVARHTNIHERLYRGAGKHGRTVVNPHPHIRSVKWWNEGVMGMKESRRILRSVPHLATQVGGAVVSQHENRFLGT